MIRVVIAVIVLTACACEDTSQNPQCEIGIVEAGTPSFQRVSGRLFIPDTFCNNNNNLDTQIREFTYQGCEYIIFVDYRRAGITHKGNCKNCRNYLSNLIANNRE